jgi:cytochrome c-type biogenesis protein CcmF
VAVAAWLAVATLFDLSRRAGLPRNGAATALRRIIGLPRSAWGLYLGHLGIAVAAAGVVAISVWRVEAIQLEQQGEPVRVGPFDFTLVDVGQTQGPNYQASIATVSVTRHDELVTVLFPERRWYPVEQQPTTEAGIETRWHGDLYAVLGDPDGSGAFVTRYYYNPGVPWMWLGAVMIAAAGLISLTDRRLRVGAPARPAPATLQPAE